MTSPGGYSSSRSPAPDETLESIVGASPAEIFSAPDGPAAPAGASAVAIDPR